MRALLADFSSTFATIYTDWILWNLFLAFIPLLLSFLLFRPRAARRPWLWGATLLVSLIGVVGFWSRTALGVRGWLRALAVLWNKAVVQAPGVLAAAALILIGLLGLGITLSLRSRSAPLSASAETAPLTSPRRNGLWWLGLLVFIAFLPNAPYLLTDIIHLIRTARIEEIPAWVIALGVIPLHLLAILLGFEAYVISLLNLEYFLKGQGHKAWSLPTEGLLHALCAVGIYLGRFIRFNSWDLVTDPGNVLVITLNSLTAKRPLLVIFVTFMILTSLYWIFKQITLGLQLRIQQVRLGLD
jgi:uncharacterized membrane protein